MKLTHQISRTTAPVLLSPAPSDEPSPLLSHISVGNGLHHEIPERIDNPHPNVNLDQRPDAVGRSSLLSATAQATQPPPSQKKVDYGQSPYPALPSQTSRDHGLPPLQFRNLQSPGTANVAQPQILQSPLDLASTAQDNQSLVVESHTQAQSLPITQDPPPRRAPLQSTGSPLPSEARVHNQEFRGQRPSSIRVNSSLRDNWAENASFLPSVAIEQVQPQSSGERLPFPSALIQNQSLLSPSREAPIPSNMHKRQRTQAPTLPPLQAKISLIKAHIASVGGVANLNNGLERPRFQLLIDACDNQDVFYVVLHQLFCLWDYDQLQIINLSGLPTRDVLSGAFSILGQLIRENAGMASNHLRWFSQFPSSLNFVMSTSEPYRRVVSDVGIFLSKLVSDWGPFSRQCHARLYPPLVDELVHRLGILSTILLGVVFTATRRNLGHFDDQFGQMMEDIFAEDKRGYQEIIARYNTGQPPTGEEILERNQQLANKYHRVISGQRPRATQRRLPGPVMGGILSSSRKGANNLRSRPSVPSLNTAHFLDRHSSDMHERARNPVAQSQDSIANLQIGNQHVQPMRMTTTGSSNPPLTAVPGRPTGVTSQGAYTEAPSPTFFQNLSIQSPITPSPLTPSPVQQGFQGHPPSINSNVQSEQIQNSPVHLNTGQDRTGTTNTSPRIDQINYSRSQAAMQQQHVHLMPHQRQQALNFQHQQQQAAVRQLQATVATVTAPQLWQQQIPQGLLNVQRAIASQQPPHRQQSAMRHVAIGLNSVAPLTNNSAPQPSNHPRNSSRSRGGMIGRIAAPLPPQLPTIHSLIPSPGTIKHLAEVYNAQPEIQRPLVPPLGYIQPTQTSNPEVTALHQAHVRSPRLVSANLAQEGKIPEGDISRRYYQSMKGFALKPSKISVTASVSKFRFTVPEQDLSLIAKDTWPTTDPIPTREFKQGTLQYRLRCIRSKQDKTTCTTPEWTVSDTAWPETLFLRINDNVLEVRRKNHHGKDLPIDITPFILFAIPHQESANKIKISTPRTRKIKDESIYFLAVEVIEILHHSQVMELCHQQHISSSQTLNAIKKSLAGPTEDDDDDFTMVVSDLSVDLADPFTARVFEIPVRGSSCLHRECFDLEAFLLTRNSKFKRLGQPCMIDVWKCPLCGQDARPYSLQIDDFFVAVRDKLAADGELDIKSIWISADGSWRAKPEASLKRKASSGFHDDDEEEEGAAMKQLILERAAASRAASMEAGRGSRSASRAVEIIELDDD